MPRAQMLADLCLRFRADDRIDPIPCYRDPIGNKRLDIYRTDILLAGT